MATTHIINTSNPAAGLSSSGSHSSSSSNIVGVHYRVGKKIGEGSFGVIFEGTNLLNSQTVAIKFVSLHIRLYTAQIAVATCAMAHLNSGTPKVGRPTIAR